MADLCIRTASLPDVAQLHALIEGAYRGDSARAGWTHEADLLGGQRTDPAALSEILADPRQRMLIAWDASVPAGCVAIANRGAGLAYLGMLTVDPRRQAKGLGRVLVSAAEALATNVFGSRCMEMTVIAQRTELIAWYVRRGYAETGETRPFPLNDPRFGEPRTTELYFTVMARDLVSQ